MKLFFSSLVVFSLFSSSLWALDPKCDEACDRYLECAKKMNPAKAATASKADLEKMKKGCSNNCKNKKRSDAVIACYAPIKDLEVSITTCNTFGLCIKDAHDSTSHKPEKKQ